ncbi:hypothetical protein DPMN_169056 [Dreissena polymorpha]|uniref:Uncharacterized protein n=1 Tax=Dreissena polymorpha TaxID=45954 RepID=A0A9D4J077_DREPO|nr:hypothetical protein DPMN_169053 [Dreissena polymorpha]KAH3790848.1 hypothetical protein DPMN_169056 [Dreissena polymorpha]
MPYNTFLVQMLRDMTLIPLSYRLTQFPFTCCQICAIVTKNLLRSASSTPKRCNAPMKESVFRLCVISTCTALEHKQVNRQPYLFSCLLQDFTNIGPKKSTPTLVNGGLSGSSLSSGSGPIC